MVWVLEKKIFYHILDLGFESVGIPVRVKFEFDVKEGAFVTDSLSFESLYNQQAIVKRFPGVKLASLDKEIKKTVRRKIQNYLKNDGFISNKSE